MAGSRILTGLVIGLIVAACGGSDTVATTEVTTTTEAAILTTTAPPSTTTTTVPPPGIDTRYASVFDMRVVVESGGFICDGWEVRGTNDYALESASCTDQNVFAIYENASVIVEHREARNAILVIIQDIAYDLTGPNWNAGCVDEAQCEEFLTLLGGELIITDLTDE